MGSENIVLPISQPEQALTFFPWIPRHRSDGEKFTIDIPGIRRHPDGSITSAWLQVEGFEPYFYVELDPTHEWNELKVATMIMQLKSIFGKFAPTNGRLVWKSRFQYYTPDERKYPMIEIYFCSLQHMYFLRKKIKDESFKIQHGLFGLTGVMYEDDIDPILKMVTMRKMSFSQWFTAHAQKLPRSDWVSFGKSDHVEYVADWKSLNKIPFETCRNWNLSVKIMSFDIEAYSEEDMRMPCPYYINETAHMNVCIFQELRKKETRERHVICILPVDEIEGATIHYVNGEVGLSDKMADLIQEKQPDIITGYNISGFDFEYLHTRRSIYLGEANWKVLGRLKDENHDKMQEISWSSSGAGDIKGYNLVITGRPIVDTYLYILRHFKLPEYNLGVTSQKWLGKTKHPISPAEQFKIYREYVQSLTETVQYLSSGTTMPPDRYALFLVRKEEYRRYAKYCIQDAELVIELFEYHNIFTNLKAKSETTQVPINYVLEKGETIKTTSGLYSEAHHDNYVMTPVEKKDYDYEGGLVQTPIPGFHANVPCEDFSAMYPSIMMAENACPTTLIQETVLIRKVLQPEIVKDKVVISAKIVETDDAMIARYNVERAANPIHYRVYNDPHDPKTPCGCKDQFGPSVILIQQEPLTLADIPKLGVLCEDQVNTVIVPPKSAEEKAKKAKKKKKGEKEKLPPLGPFHVGATTVRFVKKHIREGIAARKVRQLVAARKVYKNIINKWTDESGIVHVPPGKESEYVECECMQNAIKIAANATYGYFGANFNKYACIQVAMATTARGRELADICCNYVKEKYNAIIVYGDTDSIMIKIPGVTGKDCHVYGKRISKELTDLFPPPLAIAYEKSMNVLLLQKKHYAYLPLDDDGNPVEKKMQARGVIIARRDYCEWVQDAYRKLMMMILRGQPFVDCLRVVVTEICNLFWNKVPVEKLALIRRYTSKAGDKYFLKRFVDRKRRWPYNRTISVGERVKYIFVSVPGATSCVERMEMFDEYDANKMQLDLMYYLEHQFMIPIDNLLSVAYVEDLTKPPLSTMIYDPVVNRRKHKVPLATPVKMMRLMIEEGADIRLVLQWVEYWDAMKKAGLTPVEENRAPTGNVVLL